MKRAVFLDRDGTIVEDLDFLTDLADLRLLPGSAQAIRQLNEGGFLAFVATNQSGVARGFLTEKTLRQIHDKLASMLFAEGARVDGFYYCPHHPTIGPPEYRKDCPCRKPKPGLFLQAAKDHGVDLSQSFGVGDSVRDAEAARAAGAAAVLVRTGPGSEAAERSGFPFRLVADDLAAAARGILSWKP